ALHYAFGIGKVLLPPAGAPIRLSLREMERARHRSGALVGPAPRSPVPLHRLPHRSPILRGRFHDDFLDLTLHEPVGKRAQLGRACPNLPALKLVFAVARSGSNSCSASTAPLAHFDLPAPNGAILTRDHFHRISRAEGPGLTSCENRPVRRAKSLRFRINNLQYQSALDSSFMIEPARSGSAQAIPSIRVRRPSALASGLSQVTIVASIASARETYMASYALMNERTATRTGSCSASRPSTDRRSRSPRWAMPAA